eukprot:CAMPEP_0117426578 /NCGR_PEP_ID=MMETSP0758-20121206/6645_1 /TAXON_ID=63605 /ORGANISM="Percolomonas cosmopolitus, Strain AE-1 (ATCC 50343)" /LENGTH=430 /DNA_ID=CAMNT_0005211793 /DNA_START=69 /DNA_END=1357 /DNA_ORIENTATION=+
MVALTTLTKERVNETFTILDDIKGYLDDFKEDPHVDLHHTSSTSLNVLENHDLTQLLFDRRWGVENIVEVKMPSTPKVNKRSKRRRLHQQKESPKTVVVQSSSSSFRDSFLSLLNTIDDPFSIDSLSVEELKLFVLAYKKMGSLLESKLKQEYYGDKEFSIKSPDVSPSRLTTLLKSMDLHHSKFSIMDIPSYTSPKMESTKIISSKKTALSPLPPKKVLLSESRRKSLPHRSSSSTASGYEQNSRRRLSQDVKLKRRQHRLDELADFLNPRRASSSFHNTPPLSRSKVAKNLSSVAVEQPRQNSPLSSTKLSSSDPLLKMTRQFEREREKNVKFEAQLMYLQQNLASMKEKFDDVHEKVLNYEKVNKSLSKKLFLLSSSSSSPPAQPLLPLVSSSSPQKVPRPRPRRRRSSSRAVRPKKVIPLSPVKIV